MSDRDQCEIGGSESLALLIAAESGITAVVPAGSPFALRMYAIALAYSSRVKPPRLARSPASLECSLLKIVEVEETALILGRVLLVHVKDEVLRGGRVDPRLATFVGRMGDDLYCRTSDLFERKRIP